MSTEPWPGWNQSIEGMRAVECKPSGPTLPSIVEALEFRRSQYMINQRQWAFVLGLQQSHYSEFVNQKKELPKNALRLAYQFGVPADCLFQCHPDKGMSEISILLSEEKRARLWKIADKAVEAARAASVEVKT